MALENPWKYFAQEICLMKSGNLDDVIYIIQFVFEDYKSMDGIFFVALNCICGA